LRHWSRSGDRTQSPASASRKREHSGWRPETFGKFASDLANSGSLETVHQIAKARQLWAFLPIPGVVSPVPRLVGWGGRDRTSEWWNQNPLPYRLATPQQACPESTGHRRAASPRQRRSIGGVEPFQQARERILPQIRSGNARLYNTLFNMGGLPQTPAKCARFPLPARPDTTPRRVERTAVSWEYGSPPPLSLQARPWS
jgi:hypothetical protein